MPGAASTDLANTLLDALAVVPRPGGVVGPNGEPQLMFNDQNLTRSIDRHLADVQAKPGLTMFMEFEDPAGPATLESRLGVAVGWKNGWSIGGALAHKGGTMGGLSGEVRIRKVFGG